jgi:hypothetical protein
MRARLLAGFDRSGLFLALLLTVVGLAYFWTPTDPDVWWHLTNGHTVWTQGVPQGDIYSFTVPGGRWIMQQWLLEAIMYAIETTLGYWANVLLFAAVTVSVYALLFRILRGEGASRPLAVGLLVGAMVLDAATWGVRPQIWTTLFFVVFLGILLRYRRVGLDWRLWLLPPLMLLWANFHAGFSVGLLLLGAFVVGEAINRLLGWPAAPLRPLLLVTAACAVVSLLNPNGLDLWLYPLTYLSGPGGNPSLRYVQEWQPPDLRALKNLPLLASLLGLLVLNVLRRPAPATAPPAPQGKESGGLRRWAALHGDAALMILLGGFTLSALQAGRFLPLYGLVWAVAAARRLTDLAPAPKESRESAEASIPPALLTRLNAGVYVVFSLLLAGFMLTNARAQVHAAPLDRDYPARAVNYVELHRAELPQPLHLYNEYGWGGYLIARGLPVFIDGRADPYNPIFDDYMAAAAGNGWQATLARFGTNGALIKPNATLAAVLAHAPGWRQVYADEQAVLFIKP